MGQVFSNIMQLIEMFQREPSHAPEVVTRAEVEAVEKEARKEKKILGITGVNADERAKRAVQQFLDLKKKDKENYPRPLFLAPYRTHVNVGITGEAGTGKSSLMNSILEVNAAKTGIVECTMAPVRFDVRAGGVLEGKVHLWDLPGVGTMKFPADQYIREMGMRYFDVVVVVTHNRVKETNIEVMQELNKHKVPVMAVVNKMDDIVSSAAHDHGWDVNKTFEYIAKEHSKNFRENGCPDVRLFLLSTRCVQTQSLDNPMNRDWQKFREALMVAVQEGRNYSPETSMI